MPDAEDLIGRLEYDGDYDSDDSGYADLNGDGVVDPAEREAVLKQQEELLPTRETFELIYKTGDLTYDRDRPELMSTHGATRFVLVTIFLIGIVAGTAVRLRVQPGWAFADGDDAVRLGNVHHEH